MAARPWDGVAGWREFYVCAAESDGHVDDPSSTSSMSPLPLADNNDEEGTARHLVVIDGRAKQRGMSPLGVCAVSIAPLLNDNCGTTNKSTGASSSDRPSPRRSQARGRRASHDARETAPPHARGRGGGSTSSDDGKRQRPIGPPQTGIESDLKHDSKPKPRVSCHDLHQRAGAASPSLWFQIHLIRCFTVP